nr:hypothetical protein [Actinomycetota bacterium]
AWLLRRSRTSWTVGISVTTALTIMWLVIRPFDLYPRFLLPLAAAAAGGAGIAFGRLPRPVAVASVVVALSAMIVGNASRWTTAPPYKAAAGIAHEVVGRGLTSCVTRFYGEAFAGYGIAPRAISGQADLASCDVVFVDRGAPDELTEAIRSTFPHVRRLESLTVYAQHDPTLLSAPPATIPRRARQ